MKCLKENIADVAILILLAIWGIYEMFLMPYGYDDLVSIFIGFILTCLLPASCRNTKPEDFKLRMDALQYACTFMVILFCSSRIVEVLREHTLDVDGFKVIYIGIFMQSAYYLAFKLKLIKK